MSRLKPESVSCALDIETILPNVRVRIQGLPEDVQWIADAIETAIPGVMDWQSFAQTECNCMVEVNGIGHKYDPASDIEFS